LVSTNVTRFLSRSTLRQSSLSNSERRPPVSMANAIKGRICGRAAMSNRRSSAGVNQRQRPFGVFKRGNGGMD